jgi:hypothetical protein
VPVGPGGSGIWNFGTWESSGWGGVMGGFDPGWRRGRGARRKQEEAGGWAGPGWREQGGWTKKAWAGGLRKEEAALIRSGRGGIEFVLPPLHTTIQHSFEILELPRALDSRRDRLNRSPLLLTLSRVRYGLPPRRIALSPTMFKPSWST